MVHIILLWPLRENIFLIFVKFKIKRIYAKKFLRQIIIMYYDYLLYLATISTRVSKDFSAHINSEI